jgi:NAD(P)-dependent dehydrogenase (short-subunit alcohol dehydrogenase family)
MAILFAEQGGKILCIDSDPKAAQETVDEILKGGGDAAALNVDVTDVEAGKLTMAKASDLWGGIDVLVYNVGKSSQGGVLETELSDWNEVFDVNLKGAFMLVKEILPFMRSQRQGSIIFISSLAAVYSAPYSYAPYEISKLALIKLSQTIARENSQFLIRSNSILPGMIDTPHAKKFINIEKNSDDFSNERAKMVPMQRQGSPLDVAKAALYFASDESAYVTGNILKVDGGLSL